MRKWPRKNLGEANRPDRCRKAEEECVPQESAAATSCTRCRAKKLTCQVNGETRRKVKTEAGSGPTGMGGGRVEELLGEILAVLKKNEKSIRGLTEAVHDVLGELTDPMFCPGDVRADDYEAEEEELAEEERAVHEAKANETAKVGPTPGPYSKDAFNRYWADLQNRGEAELQWRARTANSPEDEAEYQAWMKAKRVAEQVEEEAREAQFAPAHMEEEQAEEATGPSTEPNTEPSTGPTAGSKTGTVDDDEEEEDEEEEEQEQGEEKEGEPGPEGMEGVERDVEGLTMDGVE